MKAKQEVSAVACQQEMEEEVDEGNETAPQRSKGSFINDVTQRGG